MKISDLIKINSINLKATANSKHEAIEVATKLMNKSGAIENLDVYRNGVLDREKESTTGVGDGIAIPHCKSSTVKFPAVAALIFPEGVDYDSLDGEKVQLMFLIAAPNTSDNVHLDVLAKLSNILMHGEFVFALKKAKSPETFLKILDYAEATLDMEKAKSAFNSKDNKYPRILAATACPTGIAHTYMAQEALEKAAKAKGVTIKVETNGSGGTKNKLTDEEIENAEGIIVAADAFVEMSRFKGKRLIQCPVSKAIKDADQLIDMVLDPITSVYRPGEKPTKQDKNMEGSKFHIFYKHLMSGISHMIPFVVAGGIILAIAYLIDGLSGVSKESQNFGSVTMAAKIFHIIGGDFGLGLIFPVLAGFIAYSVAGRPGLVSGFVGGFAAKQGTFNLLYLIEIGQHGSDTELAKQLANSASGFLGAIVAGFLAGYLVKHIVSKLDKLPHSLQGVKNILIVPLVSTLIVGLSMLLINVPLAYVNIGINNALLSIQKANLLLLLAVIVSAFMAIDMGGPINKAAHYFCVGLVTQALEAGATPEFKKVAYLLLAANMVGGMIPPIGVAFATWLFPQKFTKEDRLPSVANCITGFCFITEGTIPYVAKDPIRVIASTVTGAAVGGAISYAFGVQAIAPEGGVFSLLVMSPAILGLGVVTCIIGALVEAFMLGLLKKDVKPEEAELKKWKGIPTQPVYNFFGKVGKKIGKIFKKGNKKSLDNKEGK